jgi:hypothetical protein
VNKKELEREFNGNFSELRKIINSWNLIPEAPNNEFDYLNHKLLSQLYKKADPKKIHNMLQSELTVSYGLFENEFDASGIVSEILDWWNLKIN